MNTFMGQDFTWFMGIVEDTLDPLHLGRVRVRIYGIHSEKLILDDDSGEGIPKDNLPWAMPMQPINSASISGIGKSPVGIVNGTQVVGFSRDGKLYQDLIIMGTVGGISQKSANPNIGFNDPDGTYPLQTRLSEPDTNRLAINNPDKKHELLQHKIDTLDKDIPTSTGGKWSEPISAYMTVYPMNDVVETRSGHIFEIDDTDGQERINTHHKSGTFTEVRNDGTTVNKIVKDNYSIIAGDNFVHILGNESTTIDKNLECYVKGNVNIKVDGNVTQEITGNVQQDITGTTTIASAGDVQIEGPNITVGINGSEPAVLGDKYQAQIDALVLHSENHTHIGNIGIPTGTAKANGFLVTLIDALSKTVKVQA